MDRLTVIDIGPLFGGSSAALRGVDDAVGDAIASHGGFVVSGFPGADRIDALGATMLGFFDLGDDEKRAVASQSTWRDGPAVYRGWKSSLEVGAWAYNEMYDIGPAQPHPGPEVEGMHHFAEVNTWPAVEPCAGWRAAMEAYYGLMLDVGMAVMRAAGRAAGFDDAQLVDGFHTGNHTLRLLNYPPRPEGHITADERAQPDGPRIAAARHTDVSGASLLWQRQPGLQAQAPDGTWRDVPVMDGTVSVHLGTVLQLMTGGRIPATPHRVIDHGVARQSIGFFVEPGLATRLAPLDDPVDDVRASYGWHLQERFHSMRGYTDIVPAPA